MFKRIKQNKYIYILLISAIMIMQILVTTHISINRHAIFCDEVYTYGLANSTTRTFLELNDIQGWVSPDYFLDYMLYQDSPHLNFHAAYVNQEYDVHPPLYYFFIHFFCFLFQKEALDFFPGTLFNIICFIFADILFYFIATYFFNNKNCALLSLFFWGGSAAFFSNAILIRMYMLQTLEILFLVFIHTLIERNSWKLSTKTYIYLVLAVCAGGLTQYYFYFFMAALGFFTCLMFLSQKNIKGMLIYGSSLICGFALAIAIFPAAITKHISGYRGSQATTAIGSISLEKFSDYFRQYYEKQIGHFMIPIAIIIITIIIFIKYRQSTPKEIWKLSPTLLGCTFASIVFCYIAIQGSELQQLRYVFAIIPLTSMVLFTPIALVFHRITTAKSYVILTIPIALLICFGNYYSLTTYGTEYADESYEHSILSVTDKIDGCDAIIIYQTDAWTNSYSSMPLYEHLDEITAVKEGDYDNLKDLLSQRKTKDPVVVLLTPQCAWGYERLIDDILKDVIDATDYTNANVIGDNYKPWEISMVYSLN